MVRMLCGGAVKIIMGGKRVTAKLQFSGDKI